MKKIATYITVAIVCIYSFFLLYILFLNNRLANLTDWTYWTYVRKSINLIPLKTIVEYFVRIGNNTINTSIVFKNIMGNIIIFIPMGFLLPCVSQRFSKLSKTIIGAVIIIGIELLQLFTTLGPFDVDDIILNLFGITIGFFVFKASPNKCFLKNVRNERIIK